jgi:hypothetical protein
MRPITTLTLRPFPQNQETIGYPIASTIRRSPHLHRRQKDVTGCLNTSTIGETVHRRPSPRGGREVEVPRATFIIRFYRFPSPFPPPFSSLPKARKKVIF